MIAAQQAVHRAPHSKLCVLDACGGIRHLPRSALPDVLRRGDLVVANDAATLPASLAGRHLRTTSAIEVRLAGRDSLNDIERFSAIVFGAGDFRTRTEERSAPPVLVAGDLLALGPLTARVEATLDHPRLIALRFDGCPDEIWEGLARHGRPIQYAHLQESLALWDVWTAIAGPPVAFEPPSAGFVLDWQMLSRMRARGIEFATLTHAAGISSTGDPALDARLPFDEPYRIPPSTAAAIRRARASGRRIVALGTTAVRALEHAGRHGGDVRAGDAVATQRVGPTTRLRVVDAVISGTHEPGTSHHDLLRAFADAPTLRRLAVELDAHRYLPHEFGDSVLIERVGCGRVSWARELIAATPAGESPRSTTLEKLVG